MPKKEEITVVIEEGCLVSIKNIPKGMTVLSIDIDDEGEEPRIERRWYPGDQSIKLRSKDYFKKLVKRDSWLRKHH